MNNSIIAQFIPPSPSNWEIFGKQLYTIEQSVFGRKSFNEEMMASDINDPAVKLAVLKDEEAVKG
ncbi:MAG TPA: hypothetical protein VEB60_00830 [Candidatus Paceibacterota bacterium]|nr:hypothetical protein [Candidatus Paceibacterota bacterium]